MLVLVDDDDDSSRVEWAYTITVSAGAPVVISSERKGLEIVGYSLALDRYHCQNSIISLLQEDDLIYKKIVSAYKAWAPRNKYILSLSFYIRGCFTNWVLLTLPNT